MKKTILFIAMATLCLFFKANAQLKYQQNVKNEAFVIGDKVPDLMFDSVYNHISKTLKLSDYKGKAIILDFWGTWCSTCLKYTPHMQEFQKKYGDRLAIILVDDAKRDTEKILMDFLEKRKSEGREITLPILLKPKNTRIWFPHNVFPHYVWIGADQRIKAITGPDELKEENISRLIAGLNLHLPVKER
ncbi:MULTISPECIES: TlpA family protein disulfide reductase [Pedobacter]|uniref:Thiol-disulfide isomerase or thioredoxin n=1 Tax=Pedobacter suwonensis TaxID=332999 RepID=A0A1I0TTY4_9SPHI|nr:MULTISPECIES: TlpA family protein disulfide reductase [Pedobacter]SFA55053.1 Thiol-disulfide isomerase or thioredoxin [Pedobacter suwonensis]